MSLYSIALFLHIAGALGFFAALGAEWITGILFQRASTAEQVRDWIAASGNMRRVGMIGMLTLLAAGVYMMVTVWHGVAWLWLSFAEIIILMVIMGRISAPRMAAIGKAVKETNGALSPETQILLHDAMLRVGIQTRIIMALGIVFLMTVKPDLAVSLLTVGITLILSLVWGLMIVNRERKPAKQTLGGAV
ncbi:MAG: hypothetical protein GC179_11240 [Anaerolineaceae bacterium]|nr:hypothetical protein [Anaerolineaceae bacterium]